MTSLALVLLTLLSADPATRLITLPLFHGELRIPVAWTAEVEEHTDIVLVRDGRDRGCRLSLTRHSGGDAPELIRRVHEHLYLGSSLLPQTRGEAHVRRRTARPEATFGEYARRGRRGRVFAMFWSSTEGNGFAAILTCPRCVPGDWGVAAPLFNSFSSIR